MLFRSFLSPVLTTFGVLALFVGAFIIFNTFWITVAQRTREFGMIRALGATRGQVMRNVIGEALVIGVLSSVVGLFAGIGIAYGVLAIFDALGFALPAEVFPLRLGQYGKRQIDQRQALRTEPVRAELHRLAVLAALVAPGCLHLGTSTPSSRRYRLTLTARASDRR